MFQEALLFLLGYISKLFHLQILSVCFNSIDTPGYKVRKHRLSEEFKFTPVRMTKMVTTTKKFTSILFRNHWHNINLALLTFVVFICISFYHTGFNNGFFILSCLLCLNRTCLMPVAQKINRNHPQHLLALQIQSNPNLHHTHPLLCQFWKILTIWWILLRWDHLKSTVFATQLSNPNCYSLCLFSVCVILSTNKAG